MATFHPVSILASLRRTKTVRDSSDPEKFEEKWNIKVNNRVKDWETRRRNGGQAVNHRQLVWEAHIVQYVNFVHENSRVHGNCKDPTQHNALDLDIPLLGPRFVPPTYREIIKRQAVPKVDISTAYLKPITIIHPFYFPQLSKCHRCGSEDTTWDGWNGTGHRDVHGLSRDETALGFQLRCEQCKRDSTTGPKENALPFCLATTNTLFWDTWQHWEIPEGIPFFMKRCAVARDLFNLIVEVRLKSTSGGMAEHVKQLHLYHYFQRQREYLELFREVHCSVEDSTKKPAIFSAPEDLDGYDDSCISDDIVTELYLNFVRNSRESESSRYLRTRTGKALNTDATFKVVKKAVIVDSAKKHTNPWNGGITGMINEYNEFVDWRLCLTATNKELQEMFEDYTARCEEMGVPPPEVIISDNCCHIEQPVKAAFPSARSVLDVKHFGARYGQVVVNATRNPLYKTVLRAITGAILKVRAEKGKAAVYYSQAQQEARLVAAFEKYEELGGVWTATALKTHNEQLRHVQKGCLSRPVSLNGLRLDGSRIEGSHKGWNSLMRSHACGLVMLVSLGHDFVLRRNISVATNNKCGGAFAASTLGSHHVSLVDHNARLYNKMIGAPEPLFASPSAKPLEKKSNLHKFFKPLTTPPRSTLDPQPVLLNIAVKKKFGLVQSPAVLQSFEFKLEELADVCIQITEEDSEDRVSVKDELDLVEPDITAPTDFNVHASSSLTAGSESAVADVTADTSKGQEELRATMNQGHAEENTRKRKQQPEDDCESGTAASQLNVPHDNPVPAADLEALSQHESQGREKRIRVKGMYNSSTSPLSKSSNTIISQLPNANFFKNFKHPTSGSPATSSGDQSTAVTVTSGSTSAADVSTTLVGGTSSNGHRADLYALLPLPSANASNKGLTRTELLFKGATAVDPRGLEVGRVHPQEFYVFMELREQFGWTSFGMSSRSWIAAARTYNRCLESKSVEHNFTFVAKSARALQTKQGSVEATIMKKVSSGDYSSKSGTEAFWKRHCNCVPIVLTIAESLKSKNGKPRKSQICTRCMSIMYPGKQDKQLNHKPGYCSDGAPVHLKSPHDVYCKADGTLLDHPPFPQPQGVFVDKGKEFDPIAFLRTIRDVYECYVVEGGTGGELAMEYEAFAEMLSARTTRINGTLFFKLYQSLEISLRHGALAAGLIFEHEGCKYLRMDSLQDSAEKQTPAKRSSTPVDLTTADEDAGPSFAVDPAATERAE
ncbi:hypothetical protein EUX98_g8034 [Antrodiella citrinella]|uniref:Uncharacterized protein n=1 Tax=Antrodiella citrinella TaxID=2447956 RepID=A0A4S4MCK2_9APHY|nr:hypothetical protein EUX98_g8034 [Antrodiella citrinella]